MSRRWFSIVRGKSISWKTILYHGRWICAVKANLCPERWFIQWEANLCFQRRFCVSKNEFCRGRRFYAVESECMLLKTNSCHERRLDIGRRIFAMGDDCVSEDSFVSGETNLCLKRRICVSGERIYVMRGGFMALKTILCIGRLFWCRRRRRRWTFTVEGELCNERRVIQDEFVS